MSFAVPAALFLTAVALPIVALYILKVRLRRVKVSTNLFWKQVYEEKPPRSLWQNLRHWLSLLAQLLLLLLLVLAIADPYFSWQALQARRIVAVIDVSASTRAADVSPSRFEAARSAVHRVLDGLRFRDELAVVSAGSRPEVVLGMASHVPTLRRAVDALQPVDAHAALEAAIELARQLIGDHPHGQVMVFTDGCARRPSEAVSRPLALPGDAPALPEPSAKPSLNQTDVIHKVFATAAANVGITQFQARRSLVDPIGFEILVTVRNASASAVNARLELELDEIPVDIIPLNLKPEETWTRSLEKTSVDGGVLQASLKQLAPGETAQAPAGKAPTTSAASSQASGAEKPNSASTSLNMLATDDVAWAIVPPRRVQNVLIVTPGNLFLRKVFEANPLVNVSLAKEIPQQWPADSIVVLHRLAPDVLPPGPLLIVDPEGDSDAWSLGDAIENPIVTEQDATSPLMTHIRLDNVLMPEAKRMEFKGPFAKLAATVTGETVYASLQRPSGPCLVLSINLEKSDLAFRTAFPIMIANALGWFAGQPSEHRPSIAGGQLAAFDPSNLAVAAGSKPDAAASGKAGEQVRDPENQAQRATSGDRRHVLVSPTGKQTPLLSRQVGPLNEVGIWQVHRLANEANVERRSEAPLGSALERYAVNLASADESDLRPVDQSPSHDSNNLSSNWFSRPVWYYLTLVACLFCTVEWYLYQRRLIS